MTIRIIHLSDLHWGKSSADQNRVLNALFGDLRRQQKADLIVFSGDLVNAGDNPDGFSSVSAGFIAPVLQATNLPLTQLFLAPGNHDIARSVVRDQDFIETGMRSQLSSVQAVNDFLDKFEKSPELMRPALMRTDPFEAFYKALPRPYAKRMTPFAKSHIFSIGDCRIGIAELNSAWRATGEGDDKDRGALILGERIIDWMTVDLAQCDLRIAVLHHPTAWLRTFDQIAVEGRMSGLFDATLFGHMHHAAPQAVTSVSGTSILGQAGCLYENANYLNSYQILEIDPDTRVVSVHQRTYFPDRLCFDKGTNVSADGEKTFYLGPRQDSASPVSGFLRVARRAVRERANFNIRIGDEQDGLGQDINNVFVCPPLSTHSETEVYSFEKPDGTLPYLSLDEILRGPDQIAFVGKREAGKTALANAVAVRVSEGVCDTDRVPILLDSRVLKRGARNFVSAAKAYLSEVPVVPNEIEILLKSQPAFLLLDNFVPSIGSHVRVLKELRELYPQHRFALFVDAQESKDLATENPTLKDFKRLHIHGLSRRLIRQLSRRRFGSEELADEAFETIMKHLDATQLPRNGYMVSLLAWVAKHGRQFEQLNEAVLIESIVDHLLGKASLEPRYRGEFDPTAKGILLSAIAVHLHEVGGIETKNDFVQFVIEYLRKKGLDFDASQIVAQLLECRLLSESMGRVSFTFKCFQEFFVARALRDDAALREKALEGLRCLEYAREFDFLTSLSRVSFDLPERLKSILNQHEPALVKASGGLSSVVPKDHGTGAEHVSLEMLKKKKVPVEQLDDLLDKTERESKRNVAERSKPSAEKSDDQEDDLVLESPYSSALELFGRVIRNSEFDDLQTKKALLRDFLSHHDRCLGRAADLVKEVVKRVKDETPLLEDVSEEGRGLIEDFLRLVTHLMYTAGASESVSSNTLSATLEDLYDDADLTMGQRFLLTWIGLDLPGNRGYKMAKQLLSDKRMSLWSLRLILEKLGIKYFFGFHKKDELPLLENLIADYNIKLGLDRRQKSAFIDGLRKTTKSN